MGHISFQTIPCPVCGSTSHEEIYYKKYRLWYGGLREWDAHQVVCLECGMMFTNPQPTDEVLKWFYESDLRLQDSSDYFRKDQLVFLRKHIPGSGKSLFDIGAYDGDFLYIAKDDGFEVFGVEPSDEPIAAAKEKYGINIDKGFFDEAYVAAHPRRYDVVTIRHTLEHVRNPVEFLRLALKVTNPNGYVYVEVPDAAFPFAENVADFFSNQHLMHFTEQSMRNIAGKLGVTVTEVGHVTRPAILRVLLQNTPAVAQAIVNESQTNRENVAQYKKRREAFYDTLRPKILPYKGTSICIYGAGMHTTQLLQTGLLDGIEITHIVDSNPKKWGMSFEGFTVESPDILSKQSQSVLISSYDSQEEISRYLSSHFPHIKQIKLYDKVISYDKGIQKT